jgi:hypothetical protein
MMIKYVLPSSALRQPLRCVFATASFNVRGTDETPARSGNDGRGERLSEDWRPRWIVGIGQNESPLECYAATAALKP